LAIASLDGYVADADGNFAVIWRGADKVVYSRSLEAVASARTRIEREFDPAVVRRLKAEALPEGLRLDLDPREQRSFANGVVFLGFAAC